MLATTKGSKCDTMLHVDKTAMLDSMGKDRAEQSRSATLRTMQPVIDMTLLRACKPMLHMTACWFSALLGMLSITFQPVTIVSERSFN